MVPAHYFQKLQKKKVCVCLCVYIYGIYTDKANVTNMNLDEGYICIHRGILSDSLRIGNVFK